MLPLGSPMMSVYQGVRSPIRPDCLAAMRSAAVLASPVPPSLRASLPSADKELFVPSVTKFSGSSAISRPRPPSQLPHVSSCPAMPALRSRSRPVTVLAGSVIPSVSEKGIRLSSSPGCPASNPRTARPGLSSVSPNQARGGNASLASLVRMVSLLMSSTSRALTPS